MGKICTQCKIEKELSEFCSRARAKDGLTSYCRECDSIKEYEYRGTPDGVVTELYTQNKNVILEK